VAKSGWKLSIHERDCFKCKICGSTKELTVHHKLPVHRGGKGTLDNCVCWCKSCHRLFHKKWGLRQSDDWGNPIDEYTKPIKKKKKKHRR